MREQVAHRRALRAGRFVEVDRPLLGSDERGERSHELRHGGPAEHPVAWALRRKDLRVAHDADGRMRRRPGLDLPQRIHRRDARAMRFLVPSGSPYEATIGFSRAVREGNHVFVAGTAPVMPDGEDLPADPYGQMRRCLQIVATALLETGATLEDVVRTRTFLVRAEDWEEVGRAHGEFFGDVRPASTMIVVSALLDPRWLVEIEADAILQA